MAQKLHSLSGDAQQLVPPGTTDGHDEVNKAFRGPP